MHFSNKIIIKKPLSKPELICNLLLKQTGEDMKHITAVLILAIICAQNLFAQFSVDAENGIVGTTYNNIRIPGDTGTRFSLTNELEDDLSYFYRIRLNYTHNEKHFLSLLYAPLTINSSGRFKKSVTYRDAYFPY